ncbi:hypothetical protein D3C75_378000 [compost metagenome]
MLVQVFVNQRYGCGIRGYSLLECRCNGSRLIFHIARRVVDDQLDVFKRRSVGVCLDNQLAVHGAVGKSMVVAGHDNVYRRVRRKRVGQIGGFAGRHAILGRCRIMGQNDDCLYTLALQLGCVFLNSLCFFFGGQEVYASCACRRNLAWRCFGNQTDKSDFDACDFFNNIRIDDRFACRIVNRVGIHVVEVCTGVNDALILRIFTAVQLGLQRIHALIELMVAEGTDIKAHHVHPLDRRLVALQGRYRSRCPYRVAVVEQQRVRILRLSLLEICRQDGGCAYRLTADSRRRVQLAVEVVDTDQMNLYILSRCRYGFFQIQIINAESSLVLLSG